MGQEDEKKYSSGGRAVKKQKQKKIPQRGLGVAQLEKIRLEELQKNEGGGGAAPAQPIFPFAPNLHHRLPAPFLRPELRPPHSNLGGSSDGCGLVSNNNPLGLGGFGGLAAYQNQLPSSSMQQKLNLPSKMMNVATSEPPSNQSYNNSNYTHPSSSLLLDHDKVKLLGMKRTYPFSLDQPGMRSPPIGFSNLNATTTFNFEAGTSNLLIREGTSHQFDRNMRNGHKEQLDWKPGLSLRNGNKENEPLDTALTLGPKLPFVIPAFPLYPDVSSHPQEIYFGDPLFRRDEPTPSHRVYDFFSPNNAHLATGSSSEPLDLDLKL